MLGCFYRAGSISEYKPFINVSSSAERPQVPVLPSVSVWKAIPWATGITPSMWGSCTCLPSPRRSVTTSQLLRRKLEEASEKMASPSLGRCPAVETVCCTNPADLGRSRSSCRWTVWLYPAGHIMGGLPRSCLWMTLVIVSRLILALLNGKSRGMGPPFDDLSAPLLPSPCFSCSPVLIFSLCPKLPSFCYPPPFESYQPFPIQMCVNLIFQKIMRTPLIYLIYPDDFLLKYPFIRGIQPYWAEEITTTGLQAFSSFRREWDMPCLLSDPGISS